jgi:hypothetical protein
MRLDFRGIRGRLRKEFERRRLRAAIMLLKLADSIAGKITYKDAIVNTELEARRVDDQKHQADNELFLTVGQALSFYANVEEQLVAITALLLRTKFSMAGLIMYSIINFYVRLNIIGELFSMSPQFTEVKPKWNKIHKRLKEMQDKRDRLAHHTTFSSNIPSDRVALRPGRLDTRQKSLKYKPLETNEIGQFTRDLIKISNDCAELIFAMDEIETLREKSLE